MSERASNRQALERIAKEIIQLKTPEAIDAFINMMTYTFIGLA